MPRRNARSVTESIVRLSGCPRLLGTITSTGASVTNSNTAVPFSAAVPALGNRVILIQPDASCYILPVLTATGAVTSSTGILLQANERVSICMDDIDTHQNAGELNQWLAVISVTGTVNVKVWDML